MTARKKLAAILVAWVAGILIAAALGVTFLSYSAARRVVYHRSRPSGPTPADSGIAASPIRMVARDGTEIRGWWIAPPDSSRRRDLAVVVLAHGHDDRAKARMLRYAGFLHRAGYILCLFDFRSYGESQGTISTAGYLEQQDLSAAVDLARARAIGAPIILYGESMGAATALLVAAQDPAIVCVVNDSSFPSLETVLGRQFESTFGLPRYPFAPLTLWFCERFVGHGFRIGQVSPLGAARLAGSRPILSIYGIADRHVPPADALRLVRALGPANATWAWFVPGTGHARAVDTHRAEYEARVLEFLGTVLAQRAASAGSSHR